MTGKEIRDAFLRYFEDRGHKVVKSSPLVPYDDPTVLFTNAGMVQFKKVFLQQEARDYTKATTAQKCLRAGGKHNDLENVGHTARHHTFFEMLGNFSFGDYFKEGAIEMGWTFLIHHLHLAAEKIWVSVFEDDEEACTIWRDRIGLPEGRIARLGEKDNFWAMGDTGPCGPCSEIIIDQGEAMGCGSPSCGVGCDCDRFLELWNLVFMQFNREQDGSVHPLARFCIDTGMGLERIAAVVQGVTSNYECDLFHGTIGRIEEISGVRYGTDESMDVSIRVIADHARAVTFLLADGVVPDNEGRGYVLRRIIRRGLRHGRLLGIEGPFFVPLRDKVVEGMAEAYPEIKEGEEYLKETLQREEERFSETLDNGLRVLREEVENLKERGADVLPGEVAFKLYDTYGFPADLTEDIVREQGLSIDMEGFERSMSIQRARAREARKGAFEQLPAVYQEIVAEGVVPDFVGYETLQVESEIARIIKEGQFVSSATKGEKVEVITARTPYYGETGGQVGDTGTISHDGFLLEVTDTIRPIDELIVHRGTVREGKIRVGTRVLLEVNRTRRMATARNHTATHLLQAALREVLGGHVNQAGSLVAPDRFRFDFTHFRGIELETLEAIELRVNQRIWEDEAVVVEVMGTEEAIKRGATALFGEKYGEAARVITIGDYSQELCGGTHVRSTGEIGIFKVVSESGIAAGMRRIEGLTSWGALDYIRNEEHELKEAARLLKARPDEVASKIERLVERHRSLEREIEELRRKLAMGQIMGGPESREVRGVNVVSHRVPEGDPKVLREIGDRLKERAGSGIVVVGGEAEGRAVVVLMVTKDLTDRFRADELMKEIAPIIGGRGGGSPMLAQAGGGDSRRLNEALNAVYSAVEGREKKA